MANDFYDNSNSAQRFQPGTTVRADEVDAKLDQVSTGFDLVNVETDRALKFPAEEGVSQEFTATILQRRRKVLGFDESGALALQAGFGWRGDWVTATEYFVNDVFRDTATKNLYVVNIRHTSDTVANDLAAGNVGLAINLVELEQLRDQSQTAAGTATTKADQAATSASEALASEDKAEDWADNPEDTAVETGKFSALHHAAKSSASATSSANSASSASSSASAASTSEANASGSASAASTSETNAAASETKSQKWADEAIDVPVETDKFSARHWASKAADIVADGVIDDAVTANNLTWSSQKIQSEIAKSVVQTLTPAPTAPDLGEWRIGASAVSRHIGGSITSFVVTWWDGVTETMPATAGSATLARVVNQPVGGTVSATVHTLDDIGNTSLPETVTADVIANDAPAGPITISAPTQTGKNSVFQVSFSGATDPDGDPITYTVTSTGTFVFAKTVGIAEGELVSVTAPDVSEDTSVAFSVVAEDDVGAQSATYSKTVTVLAAQVIGVEITATGGPGGTWNHIDEAGAAIASPTTSWFNGHPIFGGIADVVIDGQAMVDIPKFYYKRGTSAAGNPAWWLSDQPLTGFAVMPAFVLDGVEKDSFQIGKYQASLSGTKLQSIAGVLPQVTTTLTDFLAYATNRNVSGVAGFRLWHYDMWLAIQWLYLIENATMDSQTATGQGHVNGSAALNVDDATVAQATYRGMVGLWGNVHQWMDGVRTMTDIIQRRNYTGAWVSTGESVPNAGGAQYPITFRPTGDESWVSNTFSTANDNTATLPDYRRWRDAGEFYPYVGGSWSSGAFAGLWYVYCSNAASYSSSNFGSRLARVS